MKYVLRIYGHLGFLATFGFVQQSANVMRAGVVFQLLRPVQLPPIRL
jgi:hypothetical protein